MPHLPLSACSFHSETAASKATGSSPRSSRSQRATACSLSASSASACTTIWKAHISSGKRRPGTPSCMRANCKPRRKTDIESETANSFNLSRCSFRLSCNAAFSLFLSTFLQKMWQSPAAAWYSSETSEGEVSASASALASLSPLSPFLPLVDFLSSLGSFASFGSFASLASLPLPKTATSRDRLSTLEPPSLAASLSRHCLRFADVTSMVVPVDSCRRSASIWCNGSATVSRSRCCCNGDSCAPVASKARRPRTKAS
mmetsp:Transcript_85152/g.235914  ORF Transcript_85152/g.235914 Transcript_85152/m.235914 type:complete len:258 (-) Transcript_85152:1420-2193(-)